MDYLYNVIDNILYIFCNIDQLFMAVYCANFESVFLYCATEKQNEYEKYLDNDNKRQNRFF